ncbi:nmd3 family protein [Cystoisospora suis]|uniref:60S ribosomal export protein NMD3 n=1 Tax=Cystoisospora suis TaxID=483139 RepID=A0A2C6KP06_9APIC|nr:nmd3 family protein [Cystoisospora suis]
MSVASEIPSPGGMPSPSLVSLEGHTAPASSGCTYASVLCCVCGCSIPPSPQSICLSCLSQQVDITEGIARTIVLPCCRTCGRYMHIQNKWLACDLESRELMAVCLKKIRGLKKVEKIVDCQWLWSEPHSRRVKLRLTVQKDVLGGRAGMQQSVIIEGIIQGTQCDECKKSYTPHAGWTAMVQVRQHAEHKRTFLFLEQLILKHELSQKLLNVVERPDGLDFHFPNKQSAIHFSDFCQSRFPCTCKQGKQLVSHDASSNTYFHKYTISLTLAPVCKDDLVYLDKKQARSQLGGFSSLAVCTRVAGAGLALCDPFTGRTVNLSVEKYWKNPFSSLCTRKHLTMFLVLDVNPVDRPVYGNSSYAGKNTSTHRSQMGSKQGEEEESSMNGGPEFISIERDDNVSVLYPNGRRHEASSLASGHPTSSHPIQKNQNLFSSCSKKKKRRNSHSSMFSQASTGEAKENAPSNLISRSRDHHNSSSGNDHKGGTGAVLYEVELARASDVGVSDRRIITRTHIGNLLKPGDWVKGYDLRSINLPGSADYEFEQDKSHSHQGSSNSTSSSSGALSRKEKRKQKKHQKGVSGMDEDDSECEDQASSLAQRLLEEQQQEQVEEEGLSAYVQFEVVLIKKQPMTQLWGGSQSNKKGDKMIGQGSNHGVPRPWVLQTLMKEKEGGGFRSKKRSGGRGSGKGSRRKDGGDSMREDEDGEAGDIDEDMEDFKQELEEDEEMRGQVNLWRDPRYSKKKRGSGGKEKQKATSAKQEGENDSKNQRDASSKKTHKKHTGSLTANQSSKKLPNEKKGQDEGEEEEEWEDVTDENRHEDNTSDDDAGEDDEELLANLMEGLTLENGEIKGLCIKPGGCHSSVGDEEDESSALKKEGNVEKTEKRENKKGDQTFLQPSKMSLDDDDEADDVL